MFLALNSPSFLARFRGPDASSEPVMTLHSFSVLWGVIFIVFTTFLFFFVPEELPKPDQTLKSSLVSKSSKSSKSPKIPKPSKASKTPHPSHPSHPSQPPQTSQTQPDSDFDPQAEAESDDSKPLLVRRHSPRVDAPKREPTPSAASYSVFAIYRLYFEIIKNPYVPT